MHMSTTGTISTSLNPSPPVVDIDPMLLAPLTTSPRRAPALDVSTLRSRAPSAMPEKAFANVLRDEGTFDPRKLLSVLEGKASIYWAKRVMSAEHCALITQRFRRSRHRITYAVKPLIYTLGVPGGGSLFTVKDLRKYLSQAPETQRATFELFDGIPNYLDLTLAQIRAALEKVGVVFRVARFEDRQAFYSIVRGWGEAGLDGDGLAARIHEDRDQILHPLQDGFEVQATYPNPQVSMNCCYGNTEQGGELTLYNMIPSRDDFALEEVEAFGYGFPRSFVEGVPSLSIRPETGDMFVLRSDLLHSVAGPRGDGYRMTAATLIAIKSETAEHRGEFASRYPDLRQRYGEMERRFGDKTRTVLFWS
ncbi:uncharacterized protein SOCE26_099230 [Sorangium cellulosum]|uniref:Fe2OG dioxygenase domain-containing protein n=1 Tax=Sorangium cellulosum TaxID=56 RepID=A0A2L0FAA6_SORCE|nr:hypothetical protein [Sorangium cellulosum]AUX48389.1 uncharacterized protein SOCE26_099230 [Sorangium cellulosum]